MKKGQGQAVCVSSDTFSSQKMAAPFLTGLRGGWLESHGHTQEAESCSAGTSMGLDQSREALSQA